MQPTGLIFSTQVSLVSGNNLTPFDCIKLETLGWKHAFPDCLLERPEVDPVGRTVRLVIQAGHSAKLSFAFLTVYFEASVPHAAFSEKVFLF